MKTLARCSLLALTVSLTALGASAQSDAAAKPLPSPPAMAATTLGGQSIVIHYNTPSMRGRKIMGGLVPYGQVWRTGANPATTLVTPLDLMIGTLRVPAGTYTLFTLPTSASDWKLIVSKKTGEWGIPYPEGDDLGRTPMHSATLPAAQEVMSLSFEKTTPTSTELHIKWETTDAWVKIEAAK